MGTGVLNHGGLMKLLIGSRSFGRTVIFYFLCLTFFAQQQGANNEECLQVFADQLHDPEMDLHYNFNRYYDPETGQYLSSDPIGLAGGISAYGYVDNPNTWIDPWGVVGCEKCAKDFQREIGKR